jgi:DNA-binding CsgD family transcriptional regulator
MMGQEDPAFFGELDFWTHEQLDAKPIYRDFFRPRGLGWSAGTALKLPTGDMVAFSFERPFVDGPVASPGFDQLNRLRPHLARSAFISARLSLQRAEGATSALAAMRLPALVLSDNGKVIEANDLALADATVRTTAGGKLSFIDERANGQLQSALTALDSQADAFRSFAVRDPLGEAAQVVHIVPIRRSVHEIFTASFALAVLTPVSGKNAPPLELLRSLFDLTVAEARVARGLAAGRSLDDIARSGGVSITTVRSQLRRVLEKTGCTRQAEVAALLAGVGLVRELAAP